MRQRTDVNYDEWTQAAAEEHNRGQHATEHFNYIGEVKGQREGTAQLTRERVPAEHFEKLDRLEASERQRAERHIQRAADTIAGRDHFHETEEASAVSLRMAGSDIDHSAPTSPAGSGWGERTAPLPGHVDPSASTTTTLQHGGTEQIPAPPQRDTQGHRILTEPGPSSYTSAPPVDVPKKQ